MQFTSLLYLIFLAAVCLISCVVAPAYRYIWMLAASLVFYSRWGIGYLGILLMVIALTYSAGRLMENKTAAARKAILTACLLFLFVLFLFFKYGNPLLSTLNISEEFQLISADRILMPVGMSFYMFQAVGYLADCYKGKIKPEKNPVKYALFISFFPQIISGPIERAGNMLPQYTAPEGYSHDRIRDGLMVMLWGYFQKMVLADRLAILVDAVYANPAGYAGTMVRLASVLYAFQLYLDFAGYSAIAIGSAKVIGVRVMENFNAPFLSQSVAEFWRRWHISLSTWLRDYIYIPLGGSRKGKKRQYLNIMIVFIISGAWHGAGATYLIWGALQGVYQIAGKELQPLRDKAAAILKLDRNKKAHRAWKIIITFLLFTFSVVWFRADSVSHAVLILRSMKGLQPWRLYDKTIYNMGINQQEVRLVLLGVAAVLVNDFGKWKGISLREKITEQSVWVRWTIYIILALVVITCGVWGPGYSAESFIYSHF